MSNQNFDPRKSLNIIRDSLGSTLNRLVEDGRTLAGNVASNAQSLASGAQVLPVDVFETDASVVVKAGPLIGVQPEKIDVSIVGDKLTIKGEISPDDGVQSANYLRRE